MVVRESRLFKVRDHTEESYLEAEVMSGQLGLQSRFLLCEAADYTLAAARSTFLASPTKLQLCDIYYDGKLSTIAVEVQRHSASIHQNTMFASTCLNNQFQFTTNISSINPCGIEECLTFICTVEEWPLRGLPSPQWDGRPRNFLKPLTALQ